MKTGQVVKYVGSQYPSLVGKTGRVIGPAGEADGPNAYDVCWGDSIVICAVRAWELVPVVQARRVS
jgi:hypothetical protein